MRIFIRSFGCSTNLADGAVLAGCLAQAGYKLVGSISEADMVIYNTCAVKGPTENRMIHISKKVPEDKKLIVAGCLPLINFERLSKELRFDGVVGPAAGEKIVDVAYSVLKGEKITAIDESCNEMPRLDLPRVQNSKIISIIPVSYGCSGSCAYCCVRFARGSLRSYGIEDIVERLEEDIAKGFQEFWITSQDTACYGRDRDTDLAELLDAMCKVEGDFKIRVGMMTPNAIVDILKEVVRAYSSKKVFKFLHLPAQSGDNEILTKMQRFYSADDFKMIVKTFRKCFPKMTLSTDVICGFPGESQDAFKKTLRLIQEVKPDIVNVSKFFARPRTSTMYLQKGIVQAAEIVRRTGMASVLSKEVASSSNQRWLGWSGEILIDELGKVSGSWIGRNFAYKPVVVKSNENLLGKSLSVEIVKTFPTYLEGELDG